MQKENGFFFWYERAKVPFCAKERLKRKRSCGSYESKTPVAPAAPLSLFIQVSVVMEFSASCNSVH
jgi:hypothetical protein